MKTCLSLTSLFLFGAAFATAQQPQQSPRANDAKLPAASKNPFTLPQLESRIGEISLSEVPFEQVMEYIADTAKMNVVVRWEAVTAAGVSRDKPITLKVKNIKLSQVLWMVMNEAGGNDVKLAYRASGNLLILSTADDLGKEMIVKVYDVADIIQRVQNFSGPNVDLSQASQQSGTGGGGGGQSIFQGGQSGGNNNDNGNNQNQQGGTVAPELQQLISLITSTVEPDSWEVNGGGHGTVTGFKNSLVVRNTILVHQKLGGPIREED